MPTLVLDIYKDWTNDQLKNRCRELSWAVGKYELMIAMFAEYMPEDRMECLPEEFRERAKQLNSAYRDDAA